MELLSEVTILKVEEKNNFGEVNCRITANGNIEFQSYLRGTAAKLYNCDTVYDYTISVDLRYKDMLLLLLINDKFSSEMELKNWLEIKHIPYNEKPRI